MMKDLLTIGDYDPDQLQAFLIQSRHLHENPISLLAGKNILFAFQKPSLRTKIGTEAAINHLGGNVIHTNPNVIFESSDDPFGCRESMSDAVKNISQWCEAIFARVYRHDTLVTMAQHADVPVINALCDRHHPMQALADMYTIQQHYGSVEKVTLAFVGDANNVAFSLFEIALKFGHHVRFAGPEQYFWNDDQLQYFNLLAQEHGGSFMHDLNPFRAVKDADIVYSDTFVSMGEEDMINEKLQHFEGYQINNELMSHAKTGAAFMHCLPAHRGIEVTNDVIDHPDSLVYKQAKNRMVVSRGVFAVLLAIPNEYFNVHDTNHSIEQVSL